MVPFNRRSPMLIDLLRIVHLKPQLQVLTDMAFDHVDDDGSGTLDISELAEVIERVAVQMALPAPSEDDLRSIFTVIDEDGSGSIEKEELLALVVLVFEKMIEAENRVQDLNNKAIREDFMKVKEKIEADQKARRIHMPY